jgi:hypothetical protein
MNGDENAACFRKRDFASTGSASGLTKCTSADPERHADGQDCRSQSITIFAVLLDCFQYILSC